MLDGVHFLHGWVFRLSIYAPARLWVYLTARRYKFGEADQQSPLIMLALVTLYFVTAFAVRGASDFLAWRFAYSNSHWSELQTAVRRIAQEHHRATEEAEKKVREARSRVSVMNQTLNRVRSDTRMKT